MYETVDGIAPDEITAERNQEYLYNVEEEVKFTVYSGFRIYKQRGKDKAEYGDDRDPFKFTLKKLELTIPPPEEDTNQQREEETIDHNSNEVDDQEFGQEHQETEEEENISQEERDTDEDEDKSGNNDHWDHADITTEEEMFLHDTLQNQAIDIFVNKNLAIAFFLSAMMMIVT